MSNLKQLPNAIRFALFVGAASSAALGNAIAQDQDQDEAATLDRIEVTGSRIKRADVETSQPVFVLTREDILQNGQVSVGDILQDLTVAGAALNTTFNNGGNGETRIDLRNLGSNRTLVLVNGKRWASTLDGAVDLNTIPVAMVERIEVLKDGASAIYGSDAISGVVNIIMRRDFEGLTVTGYYGENEEGDGETQSYDALFGANTERSHVMAGAQYVKEEAIFAGDRKVSAVPAFGFPGQNVFVGASSTNPFGRFQFRSNQLSALDPAVRAAVGSGSFTLRRDGNLTGNPATDFIPFDLSIHGFNFAPTNFLKTPQERISLFNSVSFDLTDNIRVFANAVYNERRSSQLIAPMPITGGTALGGRGGSVIISADNVFNPFGVDITRRFQFRPLIEPRIFNQDVDTFYVNYGFDGVFELLGRTFSWDVGYIYNDSEEKDLTTGLFDWTQIARGLGPSFIGADGVARCGTPTAVDTGCVPINFFQGTENFTREMFDFASFVAQDQLNVETTVYNANITGDLFDLPAGPLSIAGGYEYRKQEGFDQPDALIAAGNSTGNIRAPTRGEFNVDEFYVEAAIPLLADMFLAKELELRVASRFSDFSNFGTTTNPSAGIRWKPFEDLLVRANYAEGFRAPSVAELFLGVSENFPQVDDPCSASNPNQANPVVVQRCQQGFGGIAGVPVGFEQTNTQIRSTIGGNPELDPETATTKTLGFVYSPSWLEGLNFTVDWYNIKIQDSIGANDAEFILNQCYVQGDTNFCQFAARDPLGGEIISLETNNQNLPGGTETEGYDVNIDYRFSTDFGNFRLAWDNAYVTYFGDLGQRRGDNQAGVSFGGLAGGIYRLKSNATVSWSLGDFSASVTARYKSRLDEDCAVTSDSALFLGIPDPCSNPAVFDDFGISEPSSEQFPAGENSIGAHTNIDVQATWRTPWNGSVTAGARNVNDKNPPLSFSTFANSFDPNDDVPGRFWYVSYTQNF